MGSPKRVYKGSNLDIAMTVRIINRNVIRCDFTNGLIFGLLLYMVIVKNKIYGKLIEAKE